jgi:hypothetical protein
LIVSCSPGPPPPVLFDLKFCGDAG